MGIMSTITACPVCKSKRDSDGLCRCLKMTEKCAFCGGGYEPGTWSQHRCKEVGK